MVVIMMQISIVLIKSIKHYNDEPRKGTNCDL